ncbi:MAG: pantoate--beta-alanine ligase [Armatimonadota bacterium]|nr:pantoate--beta-alanine ligase [Armatimonadota bacterium]
MLITRTISEVREALRDRQVAFVPTMGSLHEGHASLLRTAAETGLTPVVSIFVNPTQFNDPNDFEKYPRDLDADASIAEDCGCEVVFAPSASEVYEEGDSTTVRVTGLTERWEGEHRPGHFDGVATVVAKLFLIVQPNIAIFGEKDWQQCATITRMVQDFHMPIELKFCPTVRESDGLAMSSRNARLSPDARVAAAGLYRSLRLVAEGRPKDFREMEAQTKENLLDHGFASVDYLAVVDENSLELTSSSANARVIAAAWIDGVRLIDNIAV